MGFDTRGYWEERLAGRFSLGGVGWLGLGEGFNRWAYRVRRQVFLREVRRALKAGQLDVADIGAGTGFYVERWRELGAKSISAFDLTSVAIEKLRQRFPDVTLAELDISAPDQGVFSNRFDAISAMDVLFHITDDEAYERAFMNLRSWLKPGGLLIASDFYVRTSVVPGEHVVYRQRALTDAAARRAGLERVLCRPLLVLMNDPVDTTNRFQLLLWRVLVAAVHRRQWFGYVAGALLFPIESLLVRNAKLMPSTKLLIYRRTADEPVGCA